MILEIITNVKTFQFNDFFHKKKLFLLFAVVLPPSPSSASGSQPRKYVTEEPPTFHDAIVGMIFRDKKKKTPRLSRASSAESVLETLEKSPKNGEPAPVHSNPTLFERRFGRHIHMRNSIDVML